jgi:hypothetical protein
MKTTAEIRRVLTKELGFHNLQDYKKWIEEVRPTIALTPEVIDRLSPDAVDCRDFWKVCDEIFGTDPVYNGSIQPTVGVVPYPVESRSDANRMNLRLAKSLGITAFLDENASLRLKTLEIGPGFGSLKNYIETHTAHIYTGFDVCPRLPDVLETTAEGLIPESFIEKETGQFAYVVSSNVFQHLSSRQRSRYYQDAHSLLCGAGLFMFNLHVDTGKSSQHIRDAEGRAWCDHYCQFTMIPKPADLYAELTALFSILYVTQRYDGLFNFVCQKR